MDDPKTLFIKHMLFPTALTGHLPMGPMTKPSLVNALENRFIKS